KAGQNPYFPFMKEKINASVQTLSLAAALGLAAWYFYAGDASLHQVLTVLIIAIAIMQAVGLALLAQAYPESHTQFYILLIVSLLILFGVTSMLPSLLTPITVTVFAINFFSNYYANTKRKKGSFKRRRGKKLQFCSPFDASTTRGGLLGRMNLSRN